MPESRNDLARRPAPAPVVEDLGFDVFLSSHPDPVLIVGLDGSIIDVNGPFVDLLGYPPEHLRTRLFSFLVAPNERDAAEMELFVALRHTYRASAHLLTKSGERVAVEVMAFPLRQDEVAVAVCVVVQSATAIEESSTRPPSPSEQAHLRVGRMLEETLDQIGVAVFLLDRENRFTFVNESGRRILPDQDGEMLGLSLWDVYPDFRVTEIGDILGATVSAGANVVLRRYWAGREVWVEITLCSTEVGSAIYITDVTEEEETQRQIDDQVIRLRRKAALLDAARDACYVRGLDNCVSFWNKGAERIYGWTAEEIIGRPTRNVIYRDPRQFDAADAAVRSNGFWEGRLDHLTKAGEPIIVECRWQLVESEAGTEPFVLCVNSDVTTASMEQVKRFRAQRLESLGTLAGGIAHDLNNVFTPMLLASQLLIASERDSMRLDLLRAVEEGVKRGAEMIRQIVSFARGEQGERHVLDVSALVEQLQNFCRETLPKSIEVVLDVPEDVWPIEGDATQILQVLLNLVMNARDAMPDGGRVTLQARNLAPVRQDLNVYSPGFVVLDLEDDGVGMDSETLSKVFEPFFTTKDVAGGTGLGLSTSMTIVRNHGGEIEVYSEPGSGTRFRIRLPAVVTHPYPKNDVGSSEARPDAVVLPADPAAEGPAEGTGERILVVDDEEFIRQVVVHTLGAHNYHTVIAVDGADAIRILDSGERIDLMLTDMMMPVLGGAAAVAHAHEHYPHLPVIAASGIAANDPVARAAHPGVRHFLAKPFESAELLDAVHAALERRKEH